MFLGGVDQMIHCYSKNTKDVQQELSYHFSLSGHENAITKLAIDIEGDSLLLASSSKDGYIRLWKVTKNKDEAKFHKNVKTLNLGLGNEYNVFLDSVLISHECSVTNLHWARFNNQRQLLSASLDCTICLWSQAEDNSWSVESRMGQLLGNKNAYFQVLSNQAGTHLAALNFIGSVLIWNYDKQTHKFNLR
jgi:WD40 repeat protein